MKTRDIFSLAVLALTMAACTSDETTQSQPNASASAEVIPFSAVIKNEAATTRGLEDGDDGKSITATWRLFEQVAVVHGKKVDVLSITDVDIKKGTATVEGGISGPVDGETVQVVYLGSSGSVMADFKTGLLAMGTDITKTDITFQASQRLATRQKGTLDFIDQELDYRYTDATLKVSGGNATFETAPSLIPQFAIWKVKLKGPATDLEVSKLILKKDDAACVTIDLGTDTKSEFYMAVAPGNGTYAIQASADNYNYNTNNITATLEAGKFYTAEKQMTLEESSATYRKYSDTGELVIEPIPNNSQIVGSSTTTWSGTLVASGEVTIDDNVELQGATSLILMDDAQLTITGSISGKDDGYFPLTIYGQAKGTGTLDVNFGMNESPHVGKGYGIKVENLTIHGGLVHVALYPNGSTEIDDYGIYINNELCVLNGYLQVEGTLGKGIVLSDNGNLTVKGGYVTATGGNRFSDPSGPQPAIEGGASTGAITLGDGIILYAADDKIDFDTYDDVPVVGTIDQAPANRYVVIKENEENEENE